MVAICDHLKLLSLRELKGEIRRETVEVAFDLFVEALGSVTRLRQLADLHRPEACSPG